MVKPLPNGGAGGKPLRILVANRAEIALRIQSSILQLGHVPLGIYTTDETQNAPHLRYLPLASRLRIPGHGAAAYLDIASIIEVAKGANADAVIPGYGFLSESPAFAQAVQDAGMLWIGPRPDTLTLFGDKYESKQFANKCGVPVLTSTSADASLDEIRKFAQTLPRGTKLLLKALEGGGGRGIRIVPDLSELQAAYDSCRREAKSAFNSDKVFAEPFLEGARHIEVQVVGDGKGGARDVGERECSLQRRNQKLIELCPSPTLVPLPKLRADIISSALKMASAGKLLSLSTFEFLVIPPGPGKDAAFYFLECNPRLQVEHTVTEEAYGVDLVATQIRLALGMPLDKVFPPIPPTAPRAALQLRINAEKFMADGSAVGTTGQLTTFLPPGGPGIRVDTAAHPPLGNQKYKQGLDFDSLLAKIIVIGPDYQTTIAKARRALEQLRLTGVQTNRALLLALTEDSNVVNNTGISTRYVEQSAAPLFQRVQELEKQWAEEDASSAGPAETTTEQAASTLPPAGPGQEYIKVHLPGRLISLNLKQGATINEGDAVAILESMKMEHTVSSPIAGTVVKTFAAVGDNLQDGEAIALISVGEGAGANSSADAHEVDLDFKSDALLELEEVRAQLRDDHPIRQKATSRRRAKNYRTARENLDQLFDTGSFVEYGDLALAAQRTRLFGDKLHATRNDGVIVGWGTINGGRAAVMMCDYGVLAATQGYFHHQKLDRIFKSVLANPAPLVLYAEGGGGRPGDVDLVHQKVAGLHGPSFLLLAQINSRGIPIVGVANGYLFAGNAALLGTSDFIIATENPGTSIGMGGPAMIEGGGLGVYEPDEVGPVRESHAKNGNVDVIVYDEVEATEAAKILVSFFQGPTPPLRGLPQPVSPKNDSQWYTRDARLFRHCIPVNRKRAYDMHDILALVSDDATPFFEIGSHWGDSLITGFIRVQGHTLGVVASNVLSPLGGAIDAPSARKASRFLNILTKTQCAHLLCLCDTPGFMVGPAAEKEGGLRAFAQYFADGASFVDSGGRIFGVTVRKAYGLGAQALLGGSTVVPHSSVAWPTGEFAGMGIEGAVKLGMKKELEAISDPEQRAKAEQEFIDDMYRRGRAINMAQATEIDSVIDPAETRDWLVRSLASVEPRRAFTEQGRGRRSHGRL